MKLRIKKNSLRLRVTRPELARLMESGQLQETIEFGAAADARLSYGLAIGNTGDAIALEYRDGTVTVVLSPAAARRWAESDEAGISAAGKVDVLVEKDFACLDRDDPEDAEAFPNPKAGCKPS